MSAKATPKPLQRRDGESKDSVGKNFLLCVKCETDDDMVDSYQAVVIVRGFSLCRRHLIEWEQFGIFDIPSTNG